ncbi:MAG: winged helix-turn-helix transcriptional regulator [Thermoplasmata archaeon]|nr:winged helix-turn-helix transcriptional regulator [Thermoplasmata archaeon]
MTGKSRFLIHSILIMLTVGAVLAYGFIIPGAEETGALDGGATTGLVPQEGVPVDQYNIDSENTVPAVTGDAIPWQFALGAFALFSSAAMAVLFARLNSDDVLEGIRKDIYEHIEQNPGEHLAGITKRFGISSSSIRHHLDVLEWSELIVSHKAEKMRHYYPNRNGYRMYTDGLGYKEIMSIMRNQTAREMVKVLMTNERANQKEIAGILSLHPSTVNWHANRLISVNIISKTREGKDIHYHINNKLDLARVISLIEGDGVFVEPTAPIVEGASS